LDFYVIDPAAEPEARKPLTENQGGGWEVHDWSPDDRTLLAVEGISVNESHVWLVDVATGAKKMLTPARGTRSRMSPSGSAATERACTSGRI
jgi:uncharacterized protein (DUF2342 family)